MSSTTSSNTNVISNVVTSNSSSSSSAYASSFSGGSLILVGLVAFLVYTLKRREKGSISLSDAELNRITELEAGSRGATRFQDENSDPHSNSAIAGLDGAEGDVIVLNATTRVRLPEGSSASQDLRQLEEYQISVRESDVVIDRTQRHGKGGFGTVYSGTLRRENRVAVKVFHPELCGDEEARDRFAREVTTWTRVGGHEDGKLLRCFVKFLGDSSLTRLI